MTAQERLIRALTARGETVATAESLTGGLVAAALTDVPGSSAAVRGGVIAYLHEIKAGLLGVDSGLLSTRGAVDPDVADQMASGVRERLQATYGLATTGVAGPAASDGKPVGTVFVAVAGPASTRVQALRLSGTRAGIRAASVDAVLALLEQALEQALEQERASAEEGDAAGR